MNEEDLKRAAGKMRELANAPDALFAHPDHLDAIWSMVRRNGMDLMPVQYGCWHVIDTATNRNVLTVYIHDGIDRSGIYAAQSSRILEKFALQQFGQISRRDR